MVVDNTNPTSSVRSEYLALAKKAGCQARCFHFTADMELSKHLNMYREVRWLLLFCFELH